MELMKYDAACRAVADAKGLDDVKEIKGICEAARAYAKIARNRQMEIDAIEIRVRAERKEGELLVELKKEGIGVQGVNHGTTPRRITLKDIGIDGNTSAIAQRLAALPHQRFEAELLDWRAKAQTAPRLETPLQTYRVPSIRGDRQKAAARLGRRSIDATDPLDRFRTSDGRRVADWRWGELPRIEQLAQRVLRSVAALYAARTVANPDPLSTMEMAFGEQLVELLDAIWDEPLATGDAGIMGEISARAKAARQRQCEQCGAEFTMHRPSGKARRGVSNEGRFCSRECAHASQRTKSDGRTNQIGARR